MGSVVVTPAGALAWCGVHHNPAAGSADMGTAYPTIELLGLPDCPNTPEMRQNLTAALASMGTGWTVTDTSQQELPERDLRRGWSTSTVLVNGRDLFGMRPPTVPSMGCRISPEGVPDAASIAMRL
jgi:hypothetical protein